MPDPAVSQDDQDAERVLDTSAFPIVMLNVDRRTALGSGRWASEMDGLLDAGEPFVLIADSRSQREEAGEAAERLAWYKRRDSDLARVCRSMIYVEPDDEARGKLMAQASRLRSSFTFRFDIASSYEEASALARTLLVTGVGQPP